MYDNKVMCLKYVGVLIRNFSVISSWMGDIKMEIGKCWINWKKNFRIADVCSNSRFMVKTG